MFVGLLQVISPNLLLNQGSDRVASTLGNPIYVGGYGLFLMFSAFLLYLKENSRPWKWIEAVLGFVALGGVFYSGTRGSLLGLVVGVVLAAILYAAFLKEQPFIRKGILVCLIAGLVASGILFIFRKTDFVQRIPAVGRAFNTSFTDFEQSPRAIAWKIAVDSWKEKPLIGWGPNNFFYAFNKYYNPKSLNFGYGETWFDNAHNIVLNTLAVQGAFGVLSYLAFFVGGIIVLWLAFKRKQVDLHMMVIGGAFLVAHFVHNITVFENPTSYLYFVFWLAFVNRISSKKYNLLENQATNSSQIKAKPDRLVGSGLVAVTGVLISGLIFIFNVQPARANKSSLIALSFVNNSTVDRAIEKIGVALSFDSPHIDDIRGDIGRSILGVVSQNYQKMDKQKAVQLINTIFPSLQENIKLHPQDVRSYIVLSEFSRLRAMIDNEDVFIKEGEKYLDMALIYSPRRQQVIYALVDFKQALGKNEEAKKLLEQTIQDNPKIAEGYLRLAYLLKSFLNQPQKAVEVINNARKNDVEFSSTEEQQIKSLLGETSPTSSAVKK
jgi:tetratricopeptide (TPR) repeat protein